MLTIVWDVDDVLNDLMHAWFTEEWKPAHPESTVVYRDIRENPPHRCLGIELAEYQASLDRFRLSERGRELTPHPEIVEWFRHYGSEFRHAALTARPLASVPPLADWLFRHFGNYIRSFGVVPTRPQPGVPVYDAHKGDYLRWLGNADIFVDDSEENVAQARSLGIHSILYPQPWSGAAGTVTTVLEELTEMVVTQ